MPHLAFNPYLPSYEYVPDGEPRVFGDRLYVYGSHDAFSGPLSIQAGTAPLYFVYAGEGAIDFLRFEIR